VARLFGEDMSALNEDGRARLRRGRAALVFQSFHLLPNMTAEENVAAPLEIARRRKPRATARDWLDRVGLSARLTHYPHQLSGGEQQRVALARALAVEPELLFADEPTGNLDQDTAAQVADLMFTLLAQTHAALVLVTHDAGLAARVDRRWLMQAGKLAAA
jgi:putative ABC transport system ATP-binding protein